MTESKKLWGGRFTGQTDPGFARFNRSFGFDRRLFEADVRGSLAHCEGLRAAGVLSAEEAEAVAGGLRALLARADAEGEAFFADEAAEDVHSFIEARLVESVGDAGRRLHTGRSRNDQVATALRLWLRDEIDRVSESVRGVQCRAARTRRVAHGRGAARLHASQRAQPVLFAHWCLAYFEMLGARPRAPARKSRRRDERPAARLGGARRDELPHRPRAGRARARLRRGLAQQPRRRERPRLLRRVRRRLRRSSWRTSRGWPKT